MLPDHWLDILVGLSAAVLMGLLLSYPTSVEADMLEAAGEYLAGFFCWLKQWQTLAAGVLALIAAGAAARAAWKQLDFQREESESRRRRRARACLAVFPLDLSVFINYLKECHKVAVRTRHDLRSYWETQEISFKEAVIVRKMPSGPDRAIANMQFLIEHLDEYNADIIAKVLRVYQVQRTRFEDALQSAKETRDTESDPEIMDQTFKDTVFLFLLIENMLPFAREEKARISPFTVSEKLASRALYQLEMNLPVEKRTDLDDARKIFEYAGKAYSYHRFDQPEPQRPASS